MEFYENQDRGETKTETKISGMFWPLAIRRKKKTKWINFFEKVSASSEFSIETLTEIVLTIQIEENEFEFREESKLSTHLGLFFVLSDSEPNLWVNAFWHKFYPTNVKVQIETFREEIKLVVSGKFEIENRDKLTLLASFGIFGISKFPSTEQH